MKKLLASSIMLIAFVYSSKAQMPPPGYERAVRIQKEREKISPLERDSITTIDTVLLFDPETYEQEVKIIESRMSIRDYCVHILGISNPEMLLDGRTHTIIDPKTFEDLMIRLNPAGKIDTIPK